MFYMKFLKNILISFILFFVSSMAIDAKELNSLYFVSDKTVQEVKNCVEFYTRQSNFTLYSTQKYLLMTISNKENDYCFASFEEINGGVYFYFKNSKNEQKYLKDILYRFKLNGFRYKKVRKDEIVQQKNIEAEKFLQEEKMTNFSESEPILSDNSEKNKDFFYDFSDEAQAEYDKNKYFPSVINSFNNQKEQYFIDNNVKDAKNTDIFQNNFNDSVSIDKNQNQYEKNSQVTNLVLPSGLEIDAIIQSSINTSSLESQDMISCVIDKDVLVANKFLIKKGSIIYGTVTSSKKAGGAYSNGTVTIVFNKILTTDGDELALKSEPIVYQNVDSKRGQKIAGTVLGGILVGVASAALGGVFYSDVDWGKTLAIGAGLGALGGGFSLINAKGQEVDLKEGTLLKIKTIN